MIALSGDRSSCDMFARNWLLSRLDSWIWRLSLSRRSARRRASSAFFCSVTSTTMPSIRFVSPVS